MATLLGGIISLFAFVLAAYYVLETLIWAQAPEGWASVIVAVLFMGGIQLVGIGAVGEYIGRIFITQNARPQFTVKEICRGAAGEDQNVGGRNRISTVNQALSLHQS
jgi:polyisoprenyl-phosphate glycosyltransferase